MDGQAQNAVVAWKQQERQIICNLAGPWSMSAHLPSLQLPESASDPALDLAFDCSSLQTWDSQLVAKLFLLIQTEQKKKRRIDLSGLTPDLRKLLTLAGSVPDKVEARKSPPPSGLLPRARNFLAHRGGDVQDTITFIGQCTLSFTGFVRGRVQLRFQDFLIIVQEVGAHALPIVSLISFLVGLIIAFLGAVVLLKFGASYYVSYLVGYGMLREMGAVMTGVIMAGRTGAAFAAQLGSMKVSEEIDALRTLGISPIDFLVLPRMVALILMMPLLTVYADIMGIFGGILVSTTLLGIPPETFLGGMNTAVGGTDFILGVIKGTVFGVLVAMTGCLRGMQCGNSADAVGMAATSAVVTGITCIIFANALIDWVAALYQF